VTAYLVDQRFQRVAKRILAQAELMAREAAVVASWCRRRERKFGPYWRVAYRDRGRQKSIYLGRSDSLAEKVRRLLDDLRRPQRERDDWLRLHAQARTELRRQKRMWERQLRARGLYSRGYAVRGMRRLRRQRLHARDLSESQPTTASLGSPLEWR
jgi:hypothetical protein